VVNDGNTTRALAGLAFLGGVQAMADIIAKACSSPQTAEINAGSRAATLMKWVNVGMLEGAALVIVAAVISPEVGFAFVAGGTAEAVITYLEYRHAKKAGLASDLPGTES
jgi:Na+-translocating ferredoxin:NAD+ oxidoreductase RnfD subunit